MSKIVKAKIPCPQDGCDSSDGYHVYEDGHGWCFACNRGVFPQDKYNPSKFEKIYGTDRGIPSELMEKFKFSTYVDEDGHVHFHEYEYPNGSKFRRCADKKFWVKGKLPAIGGLDMVDPGSSPTITVVEGELDAPSAYHMLNSGRVKVERPVVWMTSASIPRSARREVFDELNKFDKIILCSETDDAGTEAHATIAEMLPTKTYRVVMRKHKDANDYLTAGDEEDFKRAWTNASRYVPDNIINSNEDFFRIIDDEEKDRYIPTPFPNLNKQIKGLPLGHAVLVTGQEGLGKTELLRAFEWAVLSSGDDVPIGVLHFEEKHRTTLFGYSCYHLGTNVRDPDVDYRDIVKESVAEWNTHNRLNLFDVEEDTSVESIIETIRYLTVICGCQYIFIDPINQFGSMAIDDTKTKFFDALAQSLEKFATRHNVCFVWSAHVNDEGQTRDSRMIGKACSIRIDIKRNVTHPDEGIKNTTYMKVTKNRFCGNTGDAGAVFFDKDSWTLQEVTDYDPDSTTSPGGNVIKAF